MLFNEWRIVVPRQKRPKAHGDTPLSVERTFVSGGGAVGTKQPLGCIEIVCVPTTVLESELCLRRLVDYDSLSDNRHRAETYRKRLEQVGPVSFASTKTDAVQPTDE